MTTQRRTLDFRSFDDVRADVAALAAGPYSRCGKWELATTCDHLAKAFELGLGDRTIAVPRPTALNVISTLLPWSRSATSRRIVPLTEPLIRQTRPCTPWGSEKVTTWPFFM